jgi:beta-glucosidase
MTDTEALLGRLDLAQKVRLLTGETFWTTYAEPAIALRPIVMSDGPVGVRGITWDERDTALLVPCATALAASWDPALVEQVGALLAAEARRKGVDVLLAPTVNIQRSPLGGRHFECYSEDPHLTAVIGAAYVRGVQSGGVSACVKHYVCNDSETERFTVDVRIDEGTLREIYLAPFERIVAAGVWMVMASYNAVNGRTMTESPLLADPLIDGWGFDGVVVSDWSAARDTVGAGNAALDLVMPGPSGPWGDALVDAVRAGTVGAAAVDEKVRRLLRLAERVGALGAEHPSPPGPLTEVPPAAAALIRRAAAAGAVLLRNDGLLPLDPGSLRRIAVIGPNAIAPRAQGGGSAAVTPPYVVTPAAGLRAALGGRAEVTESVGVRTTTGPRPVESAETSDPETGEPGLRASFLAADGAALSSELRRAGRLVYMAPEVPAGAVTLELRARFRAGAAGEYRLGVGGMGRFRLLIDGDSGINTGINTAIDADIEATSSDPAEAVFAPPTRTVPRTLAAGEEVDLVLRHDFGGTGAAGGTGGTGGIDIVAVALLVEPPTRPADQELAEALALAAAADVAVVVVGTTEGSESEGADRATLALPGRQDELVGAVVAVNPATVVVVNSGGPVLLPWRDDVPAVLATWFGGQEYGHALADILLGAVEPGGRLPVTWPAAEEDVPVLSTTPTDGVLRYDEGPYVGHRAWLRARLRGGAAPAYAFGHGLGYTSWERGPQVVSALPDGGVEVRVRVRNTGARTGREVVAVYLPDPDDPLRRLVGWHSVTAGPGDTAEVVVTVPAAP